jgi:hypothetical protein
MKKYAWIISIFLVCLIVPSILAIAKNQTTDTTYPILTDFKLEVFREGQLSGKILLVDLRIWKLDDGEFFIEWSHVHIEPFHNHKMVFLKACHFSTGEGSVKNVIIGRDGFSFNLDTLQGRGLIASVVGKKKGESDSYSVEANAIVPLDVDKKTTEKWVSTDKKIVLPYKEVF